MENESVSSNSIKSHSAIEGRQEMNLKEIIIIGLISGLVFGIVLFIGGVITGMIVYGPQMAPEGKFSAEQMNAFYFFWTKLVIGIFFGTLFLFIYEKLPIVRRISSIMEGIIYGFVFWLVISLWNLSHPLMYNSIINPDQTFWLLYTLWGFLGYGATVGFFYKRLIKKQNSI
jgi:hypothetical protein